ILQYKVNALGPVHSITAFLPLLRASSTKKIVVISSGGADPKFIRAIEIANMSAYMQFLVKGLRRSCLTRKSMLSTTVGYAPFQL
ncbi:hypothetical protein LXA43DRAFT_1149857, partial [Ganoderma leucocontextum]